MIKLSWDICPEWIYTNSHVIEFATKKVFPIVIVNEKIIKINGEEILNFLQLTGKYIPLYNVRPKNLPDWVNPGVAVKSSYFDGYIIMSWDSTRVYYNSAWDRLSALGIGMQQDKSKTVRVHKYHCLKCK
jgi:hypothetical protein